VFRLRTGEIIHPELAYWIGGLYALLGDELKAIAGLRRVLELGNASCPWLERDRNFDRLRTPTAFQALAS
jgi:hypothetical protein